MEKENPRTKDSKFANPQDEGKESGNARHKLQEAEQEEEGKINAGGEQFKGSSMDQQTTESGVPSMSDTPGKGKEGPELESETAEKS